MKGCICAKGAILTLASLLAAAPQNSSAGLTNGWTKTTSGYWEEAYWSLGTLPSMQDDEIRFANEGWKALAIGGNTVANYPASLRIRNLTINAPSNSANLLLLNYAGLS